jgi:hypothetical protein
MAGAIRDVGRRLADIVRDSADPSALFVLMPMRV